MHRVFDHAIHLPRTAPMKAQRGIKACCVYSMLNDSSITFEEPTFSVLFFSWYILPLPVKTRTEILAIKKICVAEIA